MDPQRDGSGLSAVAVRLLGATVVTVDGRVVSGASASRCARLLGRLAISPGVALGRTALAFELWPDSTDGQARTNLRKVLHELRALLPDTDACLDVSGADVAWRDDAPASIDVITFCRHLGNDDETAVAAYGGDFLPGCYDDWAVRERDHLRVAAGDALHRLASSAADRGDDDAALASARRLVHLDPLNEAGHRLVMKAHARRGERSEALRAYHRCAEALAREVGVEPDAATRDLYDLLRSGAGATVAPRAKPTAATATLIGRDDEWEALERSWRTAGEGRCRLALVSGEPGIGKSRLLDELARHAVSSGAGVVRARAYEAAGRLPWGPVVEWLRSPALARRVEELDDVWLEELVRLLPELRTAHPDLRLPGARGDALRRYRLFDAVTHALVVGDEPLLVTMDDVQWCDADTVELVAFAVRTAPSAPILFAATVRTDDLPPSIDAVLAALRHEGVVDDITLEPLDPAATTDLVTVLTGAVPDEATAARLWADTEGNPLFVVEAVRAGMATDGPSPTTPTVQAVIRARLARLSPEARSVLNVAATVGRAFSAEVLAGALGTTEEALVDPLDELWRRRVIREDGLGYDFTHDRLREVARADISPARRRGLHRAVGDALVGLHPGGPSEISAQLAVHFEEGAVVGAAIDAHRDAAIYSARVFALDDAIASLRRALSLLARLPSGEQRDLLELDLRIALGAPLVAAEGYGSRTARESYERAAALCRRLGRPVDPAVLRGLGLSDLTSCDFAASTRRANELLAERDDPIARTEGHYLAGVTAFWRGELDSSTEHLQAALDSYDPRRAPEHLRRYAQDPRAVCLVRLGLTGLWRGDVDGGLALADAACEYAESLDHPTSLVYALLYTGLAHAELGDHDRLAAILDRSTAILGRQPLNYFMLVFELLQGWHELQSGGDRSRLDAAVELNSRDGQSLHFTYALVLLARSELALGDVTGGLACCRRGMEWADAHDQHYLVAELWRLRGELHLLDGDDGAARSALARAVSVAEHQGAGLLAERARRSESRLTVPG